MVLDISGAVFLTFRGFQKRQIFGLAIVARNGLSVEIHQILAGVDIVFWTECTFPSNYYGLDLLTDTFQMRLSRMRVPLFGSSWKLGEIIDQTYFD